MTDLLLILLLIPSIALAVSLAAIIAITLKKFDEDDNYIDYDEEN